MLLDAESAVEADEQEADITAQDFQLPTLTADSPELVTSYSDGKHRILRPVEYRCLDISQINQIVSHYQNYGGWH